MEQKVWKIFVNANINLLFKGDPDVVSDFTPVDTSIKAMIVAAWKRAIQLKPQEEVPVYNCSTSLQRKFTTGFIVEMGRKLAPDVPMNKMLWLPGGSITKCKYNNYLRVRHCDVIVVYEKKSVLIYFFPFFFISVYSVPTDDSTVCGFNF